MKFGTISKIAAGNIKLRDILNATEDDVTLKSAEKMLRRINDLWSQMDKTAREIISDLDLFLVFADKKGDADFERYEIQFWKSSSPTDYIFAKVALIEGRGIHLTFREEDASNSFTYVREAAEYLSSKLLEGAVEAYWKGVTK